jgi:hypothetical protein
MARVCCLLLDITSSPLFNIDKDEINKKNTRNRSVVFCNVPHGNENLRPL